MRYFSLSSPNGLSATMTFLTYSRSHVDLKYHFIYILNSPMYLGLSIWSLFSTNVFVISCTFSTVSFCISCDFSTHEMSSCWLGKVSSHSLFCLQWYWLFLCLYYSALALYHVVRVSKKVLLYFDWRYSCFRESKLCCFIYPIFFYVPILIRLGWTMRQE